MNSITDNLKTSVIEYCSSIGADPLLVQGAGGNVSWKDKDTLWVKASGTWLSEAAEKEIFLPVDLPHLQAAIENGDFSVTPRLSGESLLRPSIETLLHALMPHRVVVHLHAIEILAHLVRDNCQADLESLLDDLTSWAIVDYYKPGAALAAAVSATLAQKPNVDVIFLKNHGVVIGGNGAKQVDNILKRITKALRTTPIINVRISNEALTKAVYDLEQYIPVAAQEVHQLSVNTALFNRITRDWALYPDHVVFLGPRASIYKSTIEFLDECKNFKKLPELIFIQGIGVFARSTFNKAKIAQLQCYYDILSRQSWNHSLRSLNERQISDLLEWDAERYRVSISKS